MPDNIINSLADGISPDSQYKFQLDTQERMANLTTPIDAGTYQTPKFEDVVPKDLSSGQLMYDKNIDLTKLILSHDEKQQKIGWDAVDRKTFDNPAYKNSWADRVYQYDPAMERYQDHGYDISKSIELNEDRYHKLDWVDKGFLGKLDTTLSTWAVKMPILAVSKILSQTNNLAVMIENVDKIGSGTFWSSVADNETVKWMETQEQQLKDRFVPIYKSIDYDQKGFWNKLGDATMWNDTLVDAAAFMGSAWVMGGGVGALGNLSKATAVGRMFAAEASEASLGGKALQALTGSRTVAGVGAHILNTTSESALQAIGDYRKVKSDLLKTVDPNNPTGGFYTEAEATKRAGEAASTSFNFNLGILSMSNALENKWIQKAFGNKGSFEPIKNGIEVSADLVTPIAKPEVNKLFSTFGAKEGTKAAEFFTKNSIGKSINHYVPEVLKGVAMEGFWEENMQTATSRLVDQRYGQGFYTRSGDEGINLADKLSTTGNIFGDFFKQGVKQTIDAIKGNDNEISESIGVGGLIAILGGGVLQKATGYKAVEPSTIKDKEGRDIPNPKAGQSVTKWGRGERQMEEDHLNDEITELKKAGENFLSINDVFNRDGTVNKDKLVEKQAKISEIAQRMGIADDITNPIIKEQIYKNLFTEYTQAHINAGTADQFLERLNNYGQDKSSKSADTLRMYGFTEDMATNPQEYAKLAKWSMDLHDDIKDITYKPSRKKDGSAFTASEYNMYESFLKSALYSYETKNHINDIAINKISENLETNYNKLHSLREEATNVEEQIHDITKAKDVDGTKSTNLNLLNQTMTDLEDQYNRELDRRVKNTGRTKQDIAEEFSGVTDDYLKALTHKNYLMAYAITYGNPKTAMNFAHEQKLKQDAEVKYSEENQGKHLVIPTEDGKSFVLYKPDGTTIVKAYDTKEEANKAKEEADKNLEPVEPVVTKEEEATKKEDISKSQEDLQKDKNKYEEERSKELEKNNNIEDEVQKDLSLKRINDINALTNIDDLDKYYNNLSEEEQQLHEALPLFKLKRNELRNTKKLADDILAFNTRNTGNVPVVTAKDPIIATPDGPAGPVVPDIVTTEKTEYDKEKDMKHLSSLVTSTDSTYNFDEKGFIEIVRDDEFAKFQSEVIPLLTPEAMINSGYKVYIKKDTYNSKELKTNEKGELIGKDKDGNDVIVKPTEVLVLMNGNKEVKVKDIFPNDYKSIRDKTITFQMDINSFNESKNISTGDRITMADRAEVLADKQTYVTRQDRQEAIDDIIVKYKQDQELLKQKRAIVAETGKPIEVNVTFNSEGYQGFTSKSSTIKTRFGNILKISISQSGEDKGSVSVTTDNPKLKDIKIPAFLPNISKTPYFEEIKTAFTGKYDSKEKAQIAVDFLKTFIFTTKANSFNIVENENKQFTINYLKESDADANILENKNEEIIKGEIPMNPSRKALDEGYVNSKGEDVSKNDYKEEVKNLLETYRKVILDKNGNEYDNPINSYFHFDFPTEIGVPSTANTEIVKKEEVLKNTEEDNNNNGLLEVKKADIEKSKQETIALEENSLPKVDNDVIELKKVMGDVNKVDISTPLAVQFNGFDFTFDRLTGAVQYEVPGFGIIDMTLGIDPETSSVLEALHNNYPYDVNNKESTVYKKQVGEYTFYSLPYANVDTNGVPIKNEFIIDSKGNNIFESLQELPPEVLPPEYESIIQEIDNRNC